MLTQRSAASLLLSAVLFLCIGIGMGMVFEPATGLISPVIIGIAVLIPASMHDAKRSTANPLALKVCAGILFIPLGVVTTLVLLRP
jgi:hypothetical protein